MIDHICQFVIRTFPRLGTEETIYTIKIMMDHANDDLEFWERSSLWNLYNAAMEKKISNLEAKQ